MATVADTTDYDDAPPPSAFERLPPHDNDAERSVLGGMMHSKDAIGDVAEILRTRDFYRPAHQLVWDAILALYAKGDPADPITVTDALRARGELERAGGPGYLHELAQAVPIASHADFYARIVAERATFRRLSEVGTRIAQIGYAQEGDADDALNAAQADLYAVSDDRTSEDYAPMSAIMEGALDEIEAISNRSGSMTGLSTGFTDLDSLTNGLQPGQFIVVAARPAMGKSALSLDFARAMSIKHGHPGVIFSLEMGRNEIAMRMVSAEARIALHHLRSGTMNEDDWTRLAEHMPRITQAPLFIDDSPNLTLMEIRAKCRRLKQQSDIQYVIVDYLQLMQTGGSRRPESRQQEVSDMSRNLKLLAKELEVPVVALSQLNRGPEQRTDKKPMVSDLRESGSIEQDCDICILLHREDAYVKETVRAGEADLIVAKHRNGPTATITVAFQGHYSRFRDMNFT